MELINKIFNESCIDTLKKIPDDYVSLVITSPPYNMNLRIRKGEYTSRQIVKEISTKYEGFSDNIPIEEFYKLVKPIQDRVYAAIEQYANERGFDFIFDKASSSGMLFANAKNDKTDDIVKKLGY